MQARDLILSPELAGREAEAFLARFGFTDPARADERLQSLARRIGQPERLADLLSSLLEEIADCPNPDAVLPRLEDVFGALQNPAVLISFLMENRAALARLVWILASSGYLTQTFVRNPEYVYWILDRGNLEQPQDRDYFLRQAEDAVRPFEHIPSALDALRRMRRRENLRIAAQEVLELIDLPDSMSQISALADAILQSVFELACRKSELASPSFAVLAMGKLGGCELNFSSDIDLVYVFDQGENDRAMLRLGRTLTRMLSEPSGEGSLYRVDLRLRPMGSTGQIAYSLEAFRSYFETWADTADRLAFIKCRVVAGHAELGRRFLKLAQRFVYRRYIDLAAVEEVRWLKRRTDQKMRSLGEEERNVKLGIGGIREVEFFVQAFQLLHGGEQAELRTTQTLRALTVLVDRGFIAHQTFRDLREAYRFLRILEHKLQLAEDRQTHTLPEDARQLEVLSRLMRLAPHQDEGEQQERPTLQSEMRRHSSNVRQIFESLFEDKHLPEGFEELLLNPDLRGEEGVDWLKRKEVEKPEVIQNGLQMLASAPAFPESPSRLRNLVANLAPALIEAAQRMPRAERLFSRLDRLAEASGARNGLYRGLVENRSLAARLFDILAAGNLLSETLIANPELLDGVNRPEEWKEAMADDADIEVEGCPDADALRTLKRREEFKIAVLELEEVISGEQARRLLSSLAASCLKWAFDEALESIDDLRELPMAVLALGKLGGSELTYHSDLDLMLVFHSQDVPDLPLLDAFVRRLRGLLEELTAAGRAYRLDFRLRPEGRHGDPAIALADFHRYLKDRAEAWERVAYVKASAVLTRHLDDPCPDLFWNSPQALQKDERSSLAGLRERQEKELSEEKNEERYDFKVGPGGLMDIYFIVQSLQLAQALPEPNTARALSKLRLQGALKEESAAALVDALHFYRRLEAVSRLVQERSANSIPNDPQEARLLAHLTADLDPQDLLDTYLHHRHAVRRLYHRHFH
ncbi:MAG TPA: DUF294 nucleotidyltransferase-like domain-containing protein [Acidobacteriota bacterium]|nr:DUF294 nucleotidyltransferase-like domain-containing protein [Acidobacteriota bacterium]